MARFGTSKPGDTDPAGRIATDREPGTDLAPASPQPPQDGGSGQELARRLTWPERDMTQLAIPEHLLGQVLDAVELIPAEGGGGMEGILTQLLSAASVDDLNKPWSGTSGRELAGRRLSIRDMIRRPSAFDDGPAIFLVVRCADAKTGEEVTFTTSALAVIVQLAIAHKMGLFPLLADIVVSDRPTERGYYPYHLNVLAAGGAAAAGADRQGS